METTAQPNYYRLKSDRLNFRKLTEEDKKVWQDFFVNNDHLRFLAQDESLGKEFLSDRWINYQLDRYTRDNFGLMALIDKISGEFIGQAGLLPRELDGKAEMEIAYSLIPKYWKKGFATEVAVALKEYAKSHQLADRYISIIHNENFGSMAVARKHGFTELFETTFFEMPVIVFGEK